MVGKAASGKAKCPDDTRSRSTATASQAGSPACPASRPCVRPRGRADAYLVGGAVRDALLGHERADLDLVVVGDHLALARALGGEIRSTTGSAPRRSRSRDAPWTSPALARVISVSGRAARGPAGRDRRGPLAPRLQRQRDGGGAERPRELIDPRGGEEDLRRGLLRVLHERSLADDPTRALRAARYAARLGLEPEPERSIRSARPT